jgi:hypothetical protein
MPLDVKCLRSTAKSFVLEQIGSAVTGFDQIADLY